MGDTAVGNSNAASLSGFGSASEVFTNAISVVAGSSVTPSLGILGAFTGTSVSFSGPVTLFRDLNVTGVTSGRVVILDGGVTGTGNLDFCRKCRHDEHRHH